MRKSESQSPRFCFSTEDYNEKRNHYTNLIEEKLIPDWFYLLYCDKCEKYGEFTNKISSHHQLHRLSVTCKYCQNDFRTFNDRKARYSICCWSIKNIHF